MAQKVQVLLTCDLHDGTAEAVETVTFAYDGRPYAFELCEDHLRSFRATMQGFVAAARRAEAGAEEVVPAPSAESGSVRDWARSAGYEVSERGRIPADVRAAYDAAHR